MICMYVCMCVYESVCVCMYHTYVCMCVCVCVCMYVCMCVCICMYVYTYVCMYLSICAYIYRIYVYTYAYICTYRWPLTILFPSCASSTFGKCAISPCENARFGGKRTRSPCQYQRRPTGSTHSQKYSILCKYTRALYIIQALNPKPYIVHVYKPLNRNPI
jgi:hypothetical protein